jgi:hypothetical protein
VTRSLLNIPFPRFYPSISSVATHFAEYRATALGIAAAGSSTGGIIFPIMLRRLFVEVGFPNAVRISALLSLLCCGISVLTITSVRPPSPTRFRWKDYTSCLKDSRYLLLLIGSALISFGTDPNTSHIGSTLTSSQVFTSPFFILSSSCKTLNAQDLPRTAFPRTSWRS